MNEPQTSVKLSLADEVYPRLPPHRLEIAMHLLAARESIARGDYSNNYYYINQALALADELISREKETR